MKLKLKDESERRLRKQTRKLVAFFAALGGKK